MRGLNELGFQEIGSGGQMWDITKMDGISRLFDVPENWDGKKRMGSESEREVRPKSAHRKTCLHDSHSLDRTISMNSSLHHWS